MSNIKNYYYKMKKNKTINVSILDDYLYRFLIGIIIFFVLLHEWGDKDYNFRNIVSLIVIVILFGK